MPAVELGYPETKSSHGPTGRQTFAHRLAAWVDEVLYGGATGGGKTDWIIAEVLRVAFEWPGENIGIFRRTFPELNQASGIIPRLRARIPPELGTYNKNEHQWTLHNKSTIILGHIRSDDDVWQYLGAEYALQAWDQLEAHTHFQYMTLRTRLRVSAEHEAAGLRARSIATANPGGRGHGWIKRRWIDPAPANVVWQPAATDDEPEPGTRLFVPSLLDDNPHVGKSVERRLASHPDPALRRAWRWGDWNILAGTRFPAFTRRTHVIDPAQLPVPLGGVRKGVGIDYGGTAPFCCLWGALFPGKPPLLVVYRELYKPGLTPTEQAQAILAAERAGERMPGRPIHGYIDPSTWARGSENPNAKALGTRPPRGSIAARYWAAGVPVAKANNDRRTGAVALDEALRYHRYDDGVDLPGLLVYSTCINLIRTLPDILRDEDDPEKADDSGEDHAYDALRYLLLGLVGSPTTAPTSHDAGPRMPPTTTGHLRRQPW